MKYAVCAAAAEVLWTPAAARRTLVTTWLSLVAALLVSTVRAATGEVQYGNVTSDRLRHPDREPAQWMSSGRTTTGVFYSPLKAIDTSTASRLGFAWQFK